MGQMSEVDIYFEGETEKYKVEYNSFLTHALLYINNVNGTEVFESTYNRPYKHEDVYCVSKVKALQKDFDAWFLSLDLSNRLNFTSAVMMYMSRLRN